MTVTGTSVTGEGVRTAGDSEILVSDTSALVANQYVETSKYWIGQVTYTLGQTGDRTAYALSFNYGFAKYFEFNDTDVILDHFEATGRGGATDNNFNVELLKHDGTGWTYSAAAFVPGGTVICALATDYGTEHTLANGVRFGYERYGLATRVNGSTSHHGVVVRITTGSNNAVETMDMRMTYEY